MSREYDTLADVYDWLVPEALLEPEGSAAAFETVLAELPAGARVLDCACGTGTLAVGLALRGFEVSASDASEGMVARTRALAAEHGVRLDAATCAWEDLDGGPFDAVFCVGNSITHARDRRAALAAMRGVLRDDGLLALTSRTWELPQEAGEEVVVRGGRRARVTYTWHPGEFEVAVVLEDAAAIPSAWATGPSPTRSCRRTSSPPASSRRRARSPSRLRATS